MCYLCSFINLVDIKFCIDVLQLFDLGISAENGIFLNFNIIFSICFPILLTISLSVALFYF